MKFLKKLSQIQVQIGKIIKSVGSLFSTKWRRNSEPSPPKIENIKPLEPINITIAPWGEFQSGLLYFTSDDVPVLVEDNFIRIPHDFTGYWIGLERRSIGYIKNGHLHRDDGPALVEYSSSFNRWEEKWYQHGRLSRRDGPAVILFNGTKDWYLDGKKISPMDLFEKLSDEEKEKVIWDLDQWK